MNRFFWLISDTERAFGSSVYELSTSICCIMRKSNPLYAMCSFIGLLPGKERPWLCKLFFFFFFKALNSRTLTTRHLSLHVDWVVLLLLCCYHNTSPSLYVNVCTEGETEAEPGSTCEATCCSVAKRGGGRGGGVGCRVWLADGEVGVLTCVLCQITDALECPSLFRQGPLS